MSAAKPPTTIDRCWRAFWDHRIDRNDPPSQEQHDQLRHSFFCGWFALQRMISAMPDDITPDQVVAAFDIWEREVQARIDTDAADFFGRH